MKQLALVIVGIAVGALGVWVYLQYYPQGSENVERPSMSEGLQEAQPNSYPKEVADVHYQCESDKTIHAVYFDGYVIVELSNGRAAKLPQTISASGIRYANSDESLVFWSKGNTAFVEENSETTFAGCVDVNTATDTPEQ